MMKNGPVQRMPIEPADPREDVSTRGRTDNKDSSSKIKHSACRRRIIREEKCKAFN